MSYRAATDAFWASQQSYDLIEGACLRTVEQIDAGGMRMEDLRTGLREILEDAAGNSAREGVLPRAIATEGFDAKAKNEKGAAYEATAQANAVLVAAQPVREFIKARAQPTGTVWLDTDPANAEVANEIWTDATFLADFRPLVIALRDAANTANDNALGSQEARAAQERRVARR